MTIQAIVSGVVGSSALGLVVTAIVNRKKNQAELQDIIGKVYGELIDDCRAQLKYHSEQLLLVQKKETEYLKIISGQVEVINDYKTIVRDLQIQVKGQQKKIESLKQELGKRISSLEEQTQ